MNIQEYVDRKKELQGIIIDVVESDGDENYAKFVNIYKLQNYRENKEEFKSLLYLITNISENYHRTPSFFSKIEQIILSIQTDIQQTLSNYEIYYIFMNNKKLLLFLIQNHILVVDEFISNHIIEDEFLCLFFFPEIKPFLGGEKRSTFESLLDSNILDGFEEKRQEGENDSYICQLIRNDLIEEFIAYISQNCIPFTSTIKPSIFETHPYLHEHETTLIEYAAFFGSIQIFNYLRHKINDFNSMSSLWCYSIHSQNAELTQILEDNNVGHPQNDANVTISEAIKCHHNDFVNYMIDNFIEQNEIQDFESCFRYFNYRYFPADFKKDSIFNYLCKYDYYELLKISFDESGYDQYLKKKFYEDLEYFDVDDVEILKKSLFF